ncbi:class I SAM-dependent RNA methyltransferase [Candidatus Mycoplasma mahonii]|uniref:class I SAM-dependent RNA methyltransferase n=1 Tax=Candidatus Mycoplasma mahonii TaxID=3004105 RepID=UPI0026ECCA7D|nr:methyltransferase [Candidatus Mycoplasma mahonii]WKX02602.1 methyltransferase [Candidatus Mycoplasma mahonii]
MKLKATGYNANGDAITKYNDKVFYVRGLIVGEIAKCEITKEEEKWGVAKIINILEESPNRVQKLPQNHSEIGGYEIMHMNREEQTSFKLNKIIDDFKRNAEENIKLEKMFIGKKQLHYRNKVTLHDGGFYKRGTKEIIKITDFLLTSIDLNTDHDGDVIIRELDTRIEGHKKEKLFTTDTMMGMKFNIRLNAFYQINKEVAEEAYKEILSFLDDDKTVFDLYSGIGIIGLLAAKRSRRVIGVEWNKSSHKSALMNLKQNPIKNIQFLLDDVDKFLKYTNAKPEIVIVDPSRKGLGKSACNSLLNFMPQRIIYLSCNPGSQAADFNRLKEQYNIVYAKPFDMFPMTHHIENLIVLDRK